MRARLKIQLSDAEFQKLAKETGVSQYNIQQLYSIGLMRDSVILDFLIRHDFYKVKRLGKYTTSQIITRLTMFYHVTRMRVMRAVSMRHVTSYYCEECGLLICKSMYKRNEGLCDTCVAKTIVL